MNQATRLFLGFLYQYVSFYPCALLCCLPFTDTYKQSVRKIALVFALFCIPISAISAALYVYFEIGGTIMLESEQGQGCTVTFTVPVYGGQEAGHSL